MSLDPNTCLDTYVFVYYDSGIEDKMVIFQPIEDKSGL